MNACYLSFLQNVSFKGEYQRDDTKIADVRLQVVYSTDPDKELRLSGALEDHSNATLRNLTFEVKGSHPATNLNLLVQGQFDYRRKWYHAHSLAHYKRTYLPLQSAEMFWKLDAENHEVEHKVRNVTNCQLPSDITFLFASLLLV